MDAVFALMRKHRKKLIFIAVIIILCLISPMFTMNDYGKLLDADTLCIYSNGKLVKNVNAHTFILDTFNGHVYYSVINTSAIRIKRINMRELYRLQFLEDDKIISTIKILTPKNQKAIDKIEQHYAETAWREFDGKYVVMSENTQYFSFGKRFYENLSEVLKP